MLDRLMLAHILGSAGYTQDIAHYFTSSSAPSASSVESGNAADVGRIVSHNTQLLLVNSLSLPDC